MSEHAVKGRNYFPFVGGLRSGWLITASDSVRLFDEKKGWGKEVGPFRSVNRIGPRRGSWTEESRHMAKLRLGVIE